MTSMTENPLVGAVTQTSAKVSVRTDAAGDVAIEYATNAQFNNSTTTSATTSASGDDFTVQIALTGLTAGTRYWYRVKVDTVVQSTTYSHRFDTFPSSSEEFKVACFADVANVDKTALSYKRGKDDGALFAVQLGDMDHRNPSALAAMRTMHREMRDDNKLHGDHFVQHIASRMGVVHTWDDHDYGGQDEDKNFANKADALQAFREYWPTHDQPNTAGIWHSFVCGDAEFFVLDTRSQRDDNGDTDDSNKSILDGDTITDDQKDWLKDGLKNSSAVWKIILTSVTTNSDARTQSDDPWHSFGTEAAEIKDWIVDEQIDNVVCVSGDIHTGGGIDDGTNSEMGIAEMTLPHTNLASGNQNNLGTWSEGIEAGARGYGLLTISASSLKMETKGQNGVVRDSYTITAA